MRIKEESHSSPNRFASPTENDLRTLVAKFRGQSDRVEGLLTDAEIKRMAATAALIPKASTSNATLVDIGGTVFWQPIYWHVLGYRNLVILARPEQAWRELVDPKLLDDVHFDVRHCDAELDPYPFSDASIDVVVSFETLEHFAGDPMHFISESNRILKTSGALCLSTPNVLAAKNLLNYAFGGHPFGWSPYTHTFGDRHNREYTPLEVKWLLESGGFAVDELRTFDYAAPLGLVKRVVAGLFCIPASISGRVDLAMRREHILTCASKRSPIRERFPSFLYSLYGSSKVGLPQSWRRRTDFSEAPPSTE